MASKCTRQSPHLHLRSHILWWAALPRRRCSWYLDSKSFAIWQDLIKMLLSIRVAVPTLPASAWATVLVGKLAEQVLGFPSSLGPGPRSPKMPDSWWGGSSLAARLAVQAGLAAELWMDRQCWQHSTRRCCLRKAEIPCGSTSCQF